MRKRLVNTSWHCSHPRAGAAGELSQVTRFSKNGVSSQAVADTITSSSASLREFRFNSEAPAAHQAVSCRDDKQGQ